MDTVGKLIISFLAVAAFLSYVVMLFVLSVSPDMRDVVNTAGGILGGAFVSVINYWVGSSSSSAAKDATIKGMVSDTTAIAATTATTAAQTAATAATTAATVAATVAADKKT